MPWSDAELVDSARAGNRDAFGALLARHAPLAHRACARMLRTNSGVEDILQESALQAWLNLRALRNPAGFGAWLTGIALNLARHSIRQRGYQAYSWDALTGGRQVLEPVDVDLSAQEVLEQAEVASAVRGAVADLPRGQREAVLLVYLAGLSYRQTAAALGIEVGAVKTRLHKGRAGLRQHLEDLWKENKMAQSVEQRMVGMRVTDLRRVTSEDPGAPLRSVVFLSEVRGARQLRIWVGNWEGDSIALLLAKVAVPRPLTHAFTANVLRAAGVQVREVRIHRLAEETFYAEVALEGPGGGAVTVDGRPSDCIALALEMGVPIYVASEILMAEEQREKKPEAASVGVSEVVAELMERWSGLSKPTR